jgi:adenine-specific DNA-methyltransferase
LKLLCDEIFGGKNYLGLITRKQSSGSKNDMGSDKIITTTDYILPYKKNSFLFSSYQIKNSKKFSFKDDIGFFSIRALEMQGGGDTLPQRSKMGYSIYFNKEMNKINLLFDYNLSSNPVYEVENFELIKKGYKCYRPRKRGNENGIWRWGAETFIERFNKKLVYFDETRVYMKEREAEFVNKYPEALLDEYLNTQGTNEVKEIFEVKTFDFPKPTELLKFIFSVSSDKNSIILDSFAGSGTTAHAVLNLNKQDGGNRKFICIEMEDYAETITAERVKRVINGYGSTGSPQAEGTGGSFDYYELGPALFNEDNEINELVGVEKLRQYIYYTETKCTLSSSGGGVRRTEEDVIKTRDVKDNDYLLNKHHNTAYYFYYEQDMVTTLNHDFLSTIKTKAEQYVIYADNCLLTKEFMTKHHIIFKKIPRDITKF